MNYKQTALIVVSICWIIIFISGLAMNLDLMLYSIISMIITGFATLTYHGHAGLNYKDEEKIKKLNSKIISLDFELKKRTAI